MQPGHRIDELIVDLSFTTTRLARHEKVLLSDWLSEDLLPALDQLFSRYSPGQQILRFETLEFDFGNLTNRNYQQMIREQLLQKFAQLLQTQLLAAVPTTPGLPAHTVGGDSQNTRVALTQLFNYLATGQLSAHQPFEQQTALHEQLLDVVIGQQNIAELLRELPQRDLLIQRLLSQFSVPQRLELLRQLAPQHLQNTIALLDLLQFFSTNNFNTDFSSLNLSSFNSHLEDGLVKKRIIENGFTSNDLKQADVKQAGIFNRNGALQNLVWQTLLQLGLEFPQATETFWLDYILGKVSDFLAINETWLTQYLMAIKVPASSAATPLINLQTKIAQLSKGQSVTAGNEFPEVNSINEHNSLDSGQQKNPEQLRQLIAAAFIRADASQLQPLWPQLIANEPQLLLSALKHYLLQAEIRQQLMMRFPLALQVDIIVFLAPTIKPLFSQLQNKVSELIELVHFQSNDKSRELSLNKLSSVEHDNQRNASTRESTLSSNKTLVTSDDSPELFRRRLWEIAVGLILENCSVAPDSKYTGDADSFLMMLAAHYAELHSLNTPILQQAWARLLLDKQENNAFDNRVFDSRSNHLESADKLSLLHEQQLAPLVAATVWDTSETDNAQKLRDPERQNNSQQLTSQTKESSFINDRVLLEQATKPLLVDLHKELADQENPSPADKLVSDLAGISDHQLFDLCLRLKSGALAWSQLSHNVELLQRLINSYIRLGHSATAENCADFVAAIDAQAALTNSAVTYYLVVLQTLIADKLVDLDAIAIAVKNNFNPSAAQHLTSVLDEQELISISDIPNPVIAKTLQLEELALQLQQGNIRPDSLDLSSEKFAELVNIFISTDKTIALDVQTDLTTAIHQQAQQVSRKDYYYRQVLILLVRKDVVNLMEICNQVDNHDEPEQHIADNKSREKEINVAQQRTQIANEPLVLESAPNSSATTEISSHQAINQEIIPPLSPIPITPVSSIVEIAQALLSEMQPTARLQTLRFDTAQWQRLAVEVIQQAQFVDKDSKAELIETIQTRAHQAITTSVYYRLIVEAVLTHRPIDLDAFTATANSEQQAAINNPLNGLTNEVGVAGFSNSDINQNNSPLVPVQISAASSSIASEINPNQVIDQEIITQLSPTPITQVSSIAEIAQALLSEMQSTARLQTLRLDTAQWQRLTVELIQQAPFVDKNSSAELIKTIQNQSRQAINPVAYYRLVIEAVLTHQPINLEAFAATATTADSEQQTAINNPRNGLTDEAGVAGFSNSDTNQNNSLLVPVQIRASSSSIASEINPNQAMKRENIPQSSPTPIAQVSSISEIAQALLSEMQPTARLQTLRLDTAQWQRLMAELIQQAEFIDKDSKAGLIDTIQTYARQAINTSVYYHLIIEAVLTHQPIDLETFSATATATTADSEQQATINNPLNGLTDEAGVAGFSNSDTNQNNSPLVPVQISAASSSIASEINPNQVMKQEIIPQSSPPPITQTGNIAEITQALLSEMQPTARLQTLRLDTAQWQRLTVELIQQAPFVDKNSSAELIETIQNQSRQAINPVAYYRLVIEAVLTHQPINLEAFAATATATATTADSEQQTAINNPLNGLTDEAGVAGFSNSDTNQNNSLLVPVQISASSSSIASEINPNQVMKRENIPQSSPTPIAQVSSISEIAQALLSEMQPTARLKTLRLDTAQWQRLMAELIQQAEFIDKDSKAGLIDAIQTYARQAINTSVYYHLVIEAVLKHQPIDLETFSTTATTTADSEQQTAINNHLNDLADETGITGFVDNKNSSQRQYGIEKNESKLTKDSLRLTKNGNSFASAENSSTELIQNQVSVNPQNDSQRFAVPITATTSINVIAQTLLAEPQSWARLQHLRLEDAQWKKLLMELIQQAPFVDASSNSELIEAIQTQARQAINASVYYRLAINAVLQKQPIDLEAFAATAIDKGQTPAIDNTGLDSTDIAEVVAIADAYSNQNLSQVESGQFVAEQFAVEQSNAEQFNTDQLQSGQFNSEQPMDYSLLTGSDHSLRRPVLSLAQLLAAELPLSQEQLLTLQQYINTLLNRPNQALITEWRELLVVVQHAQVLIHSVPAHLLHQIAMRLQTGPYTWLDALVKVVMEALALLIGDTNNLTIKQARWGFVFNYLFAPANNNNNVAETSARAAELSIELCEQLASAAGMDDVQRLVNLTQRRIALLKPPAQQKPAMRLQDITTNPATHSDATTPQWEAGLHINNAGQVLAAAFLPRLFSMLNLMQDGKFIHLGAADRAVHLVQFMVTGQSATPEYELILNKILCGIGTSIPVSAGIDITEQEQTLIEQMLTSMIQHWKVLGSTSITGLRETFFQRQGWLVLEEDCWRLKVKEQTFDLLLDRLPWSISLIKHGWMDKPLRVSWRDHS